MKLALVCVVVAAGCTDDGPKQTGPIVAFEQVHPILSAKCGDCHQVGAPKNGALGFLGPDPQNEYEVAIDSVFLVGDLTLRGSPIMTMIDIDHHQNITYTDDEHAKLRAWLEAETQERYGADLDTASNLADAAVRQWSGCLSQADFATANMASVWGSMMTSAGQKCTGCHDAQGTLPFAVSPNGEFFSSITMHRRLLVEWFTLGSTADQVVVDTHSFDVTGNRKGPHVGHPMYVLTAGLSALQMWAQLAQGHKMNGTCGTPTLVD